MNPYLLLILLSSWAHVVPLSLQCETGVAYPKHMLSVTRSLLNNADVALLKTYQTETLDKCITDCCSEKYGACSIASFKKNATSNCQHFNCRPVTKCMFLSSNSTDSFSFTSSSSPEVLVPSSNASKQISSSTKAIFSTTNKPKTDESQDHGVTKEALEEFAFKDDNTTVKPRKGVVDVTDNSLENTSRSGVKPRKGVEIDAVKNPDDSESKVKPRKGVGPYQSHLSSPQVVTVNPTIEHSTLFPSTKNEHSSASEHSSTSLVTTKYKDIADDVESALKKVFEDETTVKDIKPSTIPTDSENLLRTSLITSSHSFIPSTVATVHSTSSTKQTTSSVLESSLTTTNHVATSSVLTPHLDTISRTTEVASHTRMPSSSSPAILEHSKLLFHESLSGDAQAKDSSGNVADSESESERKYKSSMHLVLSLVFGLLVLFTVLGVIAKRVYDSWMRRHYRRMDFLIDGMYNGYG